MKWFKGSILCFLLLLTGCAQQQVVADKPDSSTLNRLGKSDIDEVLEYHQYAVMRDLKSLMIKLYRRNPNQRHDRKVRSIEDSVDRLFARPSEVGFEQWQAIKPTGIIQIAFDETYKGDRVLAFIVGLRRMLMASYDNHTEFYFLTSIDAQKLYNSARNIETAAWMLANSKDSHGKLLLLSDSVDSEQRNISYQRLIGRLIATQDNIAEIISFKNGRLIKTVFQTAASMVFIPI